MTDITTNTPHTPTTHAHRRYIWYATLLAPLLLASCTTSASSPIAQNQPLPPVEELSDEAYWQRAKTQYTDFHAALAPLHLHFFDGQWPAVRTPAPYADHCPTDTYGWQYDAFTGGENFDNDNLEHTTHTLLTWLDDQGWQTSTTPWEITTVDPNTNTQETSLGLDINTSHHTQGVHQATIEIRSFHNHITLTIHAQSTCYHGDPIRLAHLIYPDNAPNNQNPFSIPTYPTTIHPNDQPPFRYSIQDNNATPSPRKFNTTN